MVGTLTSSVFQEAQEGLVAAVSAGASVDDAARSHGVPVGTVRSWLARGRKAPDGPYGGFASRVDAARRLQRLPAPQEVAGLTPGEFEELLAEKVRSGSVPAMRLWLDLHRSEFEEGGGVADDPFREFDAA